MGSIEEQAASIQEQPTAELPSKDELLARAAEGDTITQDEVSRLAEEEAKLNNQGLPAKGSVAATAQSIHDKQENFLETAAEVKQKKPEEITKEDAAKLMSAQVCFLSLLVICSRLGLC